MDHFQSEEISTRTITSDDMQSEAAAEGRRLHPFFIVRAGICSL